MNTCPVSRLQRPMNPPSAGRVHISRAPEKPASCFFSADPGPPGTGGLFGGERGVKCA